jgi:hypothetical protein
MLIVYVATITAVLLTAIFCLATEAAGRWKGVVAGLAVLSLIVQFAVSTSWARPTAMAIQALVGVGIAFYPKLGFT